MGFSDNGKAHTRPFRPFLSCTGFFHEPIQDRWYIHQALFLVDTTRKSGEGLISSEDHLVIVPVPSFNKCVHSKCTGTQFYQLCLDLSEIALEVGRAQDLCVWCKGSGIRVDDLSIHFNEWSVGFIQVKGVQFQVNGLGSRIQGSGFTGGCGVEG